MADKKAIKGVIYLIAITSILLAILIAGNNSLLPLLAVYIGMLVVSAFIINSKDFKDKVIGLRRDNLGKSILYAFGLTIVFYGIAKVTGLSIGIPLNFQSTVGDGTRFLIILIGAPLVETIFFQVSAFAVLWSITNKKILSIILTSLLFSGAHLSAYVSQFYSYPSLTQGFSALGQNAGSFVAAFIFSFVAMIVLVQPKVKNQWFTILFHLLMNVVITIILSLIIIS